MSKKQTQKLITPEIFHQAVIGSFHKAESTIYDEKSGHVCGRSRLLYHSAAFFLFQVCLAIWQPSNLRIYNIIVCVVLFVTVLFANFAESVAEGRGKAQAASLKKDAERYARRDLLGSDGTRTDILIQRAEERRRRYGFCRRDYSRRWRSYRRYRFSG